MNFFEVKIKYLGINETGREVVKKKPTLYWQLVSQMQKLK